MITPYQCGKGGAYALGGLCSDIRRECEVTVDPGWGSARSGVMWTSSFCLEARHLENFIFGGSEVFFRFW